jgi:anti-sigma28 factor (negative regulator of flagellin synthesis)
VEIKPISRVEPLRDIRSGLETGPDKSPYEKDSVKISKLAREKALVEAHIDEKDLEREKKIQRIKKEIRQCRYEMNEKKMECIINSLILNLS